MNKTIFTVKGMHCAVCARNVELTVSNLNSVTAVSVNLPNETASVVYDANILSEKDIINAINALGFAASLPTGDDEEQKKKELSAEKARVIISLAFSLLLFLAAMGPMLGLFSLPSFLASPKTLTALQIALTIPVIICGFNFYSSGFKALFGKAPNMDTLVAFGTLAAILYSIYSAVLVFSGNHHAVHNLYFESAAMIIALVKLGKFLEKRATEKTSAAVKKLVSLVPDFATVIRNGEETDIPAEDVVTDDIIIVRPGNRIPVDGIIIYGDTEIDESMISGESMPIAKSTGDEVIGGCVNCSGFIKIKALRIGEDTTLAKIVKAVSEAQASKAPIARLADTVAGYFVPVVFAIAFVSALCWFFAGKDFSFVLSVFISVLVISCPCALGLATPVAIMAGTGRAAEYGILFRNGAALEYASKIDVIAFDKTGTLTLGKPSITDINSDISPDELLSLAASCEAASEHLIGKAIVSYAIENGISYTDATDFEYVVGSGVSATVNSKRVSVGNKNFVKESEAFSDVADNFSENGKTPVFVSENDKILGVIAIADEPKENAEKVISDLSSEGFEIYMLTGDNEKTGNAIARDIGIENVISGINPNQKASEIEKLKVANKRVCMVGDGINDAPALAASDVSITVASGTDIAAESSDVVLIKNDLNDILKVIRISRAVTRNIKQNLFWAFAYNIIGIPVAAGLLYALGGPLLNPMFGALAMSLSSVTVVLNALRLSRKHF